MYTESILAVEIVEDNHQESLIVTLLNIISLNKYLTDLENDERLRKSDIICLTETQLTPNSDITEIATLPGFEVAYNDSQDRFQRIAVCATVDTNIISHTKPTGAYFIAVLKYNLDKKIHKFAIVLQETCITFKHFR